MYFLLVCRRLQNQNMLSMNDSSQLTLSNVELRGVQMVLLELLCEARRICELAGIRYTIIAGTMLGAVRHGGFIPWDDDADIALFRDDYEAFLTACGKHLDTSRFYFQDHTNTKGYRWGYGKLRRKDTRYVVCGTEDLPYDQGIWIDIFPLDSVPNSRPGRMACNLHCFFIRKLLYAEAGKHREHSRVKRALYALLSAVPVEAVLAHYTKYVHRRNRKRTGWVRILMFPTPNREYGYLRKWYENRSDIVFEGELFAGIHDYDEYLTFKFGRYLELPPQDQRKQHRVCALKLPEPTGGI